MKNTWQETPFCLNVNPNPSPRPVIKGMDGQELPAKQENVSPECRFQSDPAET